jgi:hypothetical protein
MLTPSLRQEFTQLLVSRSRVVCSILVDSLFLLVWLIVQLVFARITAGVKIAGAENWAFPIAQAVLAISTLAAILLYIYWDLKTLYLRGPAPPEEHRQGFVHPTPPEIQPQRTLLEPRGDGAPGGPDNGSLPR